MSFLCQFSDPHLTICHSNINVQIIVVFVLGTSTLSDYLALLSTRVPSASLDLLE